jgi:hypothetical protein
MKEYPTSSDMLENDISSNLLFLSRVPTCRVPINEAIDSRRRMLVSSFERLVGFICIRELLV